MRFIDLRDAALADDQRTRLCWLYYDEIYRAAFPIADEAEDPSVWLPLLVEVPTANPITHVVLAIGDARPPQAIDAASLLGGIIFEFFRTSRTGLATYLCIRPQARGRGIAKSLLDQCLARIRADAGGAAVPLFAEAENPDAQPDASLREAARARLPILSRLGFRELPIRYRQPALGPGKRPLDSLKFLLFAGDEPARIKRSTVQTFMREFYAVLDAGAPDEARMFGALSGEDIVALPLPEST